MGGTCINEGCTPTKTIIASARVAHLVGRAVDYGVNSGEVSIDLSKVRERKRNIVKSFREGSLNRIKKKDGLSLIRGEASFTAPYSLEVTRDTGARQIIEAEKIFINTAVRPSHAN